MKHTLRYIFPIVLSSLLLSCDKPKDQHSAKAGRADVTISNYFNADGVKNIKSWESRDKVGFLTVGSDVSETCVPLSTGTQTSRFTFSTTAGDGDIIAAYYPAGSADFKDGKITAELSSNQNATVSLPLYVGNAAFSESSQTNVKISLNPLWCVLYAKVSLGDYTIKKAVLTGNNNEKIAGKITIDPSDLSIEATETSVTVDFNSGRDCRLEGFSFPIVIAPVTFTKGYTIRYITDNGAEFEYKTTENIVAEKAGKIDVGGAQGDQPTQLLVCGDNMIYHINADLAATKGFSSSIIWQWDAKSVMNVIGKDGLRLDECKPVDNNTKILVTSSRGFALLLEKETKEMLWYSNVSSNAHSAELLPGDRIAVACSEGGDCVQVFDIKTPNKVICSVPMPYAHGVLWNAKHQRLYAIGNNSFNTYRLENWDSDKPSLVLESSLDTYKKAWGLHDLTYVNDDTVLISGNRAGFLDVTNNTFTALACLSNSTQIKAVNYNISTGECWYVDSTQPEGDFTWSSKTIHYTDDVQSTAGDKKTIKNIPINMYKARVLNW